MAATGAESSVNGHSDYTPNGSRPRTPSMNNLSLTEYTANPSPPSASPKSKVKGVIPEEFILPNGYPDVSVLHVPFRDPN